MSGSRSSSASCSTRSLNSSHDSSRLMNSDLSSRSGSAARSPRPRPSGRCRICAADRLPVGAHCTRSCAPAGDRAELRRAQQHDQLALLDAREPAFAHPNLGAGHVVQRQRERGIVANEQHLAASGRQLGGVKRLARTAPALLDVTARAARTRARGAASRGPSGWTGRRRCARPRRLPAPGPASVAWRSLVGSAAATHRGDPRPHQRVAAARSSSATLRARVHRVCTLSFLSDHLDVVPAAISTQEHPGWGSRHVARPS